MDKRQNVASPVSIFYSYAPEDENLRRMLEKHLSLLRHQGVISNWHDHKIIAGSNREQSIDNHLNTAALILLLISPDFLASDYCYGVEMQRAMELHEAGQARVIPILLRPVDWHTAPFAHLQCLPRNEKPVTQWSNRDEAFLAIAQGIRAAVETIYGPIAVPRLPLSTAPQKLPAATKQEQQNRRRFLKRVRTTWITGVLEHSLYNATLMTLGLTEHPDALANPWHLLVQETDQPPRPLPAGTTIAQVYDAADGALLILGEPGAGKTTLLLELARTLLERAEHITDHPLPAVFNLSSWAQKRQPLASWLVEELHDKYQVPRKLGASWIASDQLLPLLDGLDEVVQGHRSACIDAINQYRQEHPLASLVLCSRSAEYLDQPGRVLLQKSVMVQPLTIQQIDEYLSIAGEQVAAVRVALQDDADLQELATTPLMLNILMLTYQDKALDELIAIKSPELRRQQIFDQYVKRMFKRRTAETLYTSHKTKVWLACLAMQMKRQAQTEFYIERMQMDWLVYSKLILWYKYGTMLICILIGALVGVVAISLIDELDAGLLRVLIGILGFGLVGGVMGRLNLEIRPPEGLSWSWRVVLQRWLNVPLLMLAGGVLGGVDINLRERTLAGVLVGTLFGMLFSILFNVLVGGLTGVMPATRHITTPNQEIRRAARHSLFVVLFGTLFDLPFIALNDRSGILMVVGFMLLGGLGFGGLACIQHIILRFLLWRSGQLPWDLPRFLDYAAERILLRKVGGGYIFIHRLLLDHFASLNETPEAD